MARPHRDQIQAHAGARLSGQTHVLEHAQLRKQVGELERPPHAAACALRCGQRGHVLAKQFHRATGRGQLAGNQVEVSSLARAVGADDGGECARTERAGHPVDRDVAAEADGQVACLKSRMFAGARFGHEKISMADNNRGMNDACVRSIPRS
jgi:hypothetical protein